jgi:hypothetical protein
MTISSYTTADNAFRFRVFSSMYLDWGLEIQVNIGMGEDGQDLYYSPSSLSRESYGFKPNPEKFEDWEDAENASLEGDEDAFVPWNEKDWQDCLKCESDDILEAYVSPEMLAFVDSWKDLHGEDYFQSNQYFTALS